MGTRYYGSKNTRTEDGLLQAAALYMCILYYLLTRLSQFPFQNNLKPPLQLDRNTPYIYICIYGHTGKYRGSTRTTRNKVSMILPLGPILAST